jgi:hypothetical protein
MKLYKTTAGKVLIFLYYALFFIADFVLTMFIMLKTDSIFVALGISIVLGFGIGILGGELEFRDHCHALRKKYSSGYREKETKNIINFPTQT